MLMLVCIVLVIWAVYHSQKTESFKTKQDKANTIYDWFMRNPVSLYAAYKRDLNSESNIVEYEDIMALRNSGKLTLENVKRFV